MDGINTICLETDCFNTKEALQLSLSLAHGKCQVLDGSPAYAHNTATAEHTKLSWQCCSRGEQVELQPLSMRLASLGVD